MELDSIELPYGQNVWYNKPSGEHYKLLNLLCKDKDLVYDVGTYRGYSALAMTSAKKVISYDIQNQREIKRHPKIEFKIGDVLADSKLVNADLILLDTFHNGPFEMQFLERLDKIGYKGVLVMDDINYNDSMREVWRSIKHRKEDVTEFGHYTGTGIVYFE